MALSKCCSDSILIIHAEVSYYICRKCQLPTEPHYANEKDEEHADITGSI